MEKNHGCFQFHHTDSFLNIESLPQPHGSSFSPPTTNILPSTLNLFLPISFLQHWTSFRSVWNGFRLWGNESGMHRSEYLPFDLGMGSWRNWVSIDSSRNWVLRWWIWVLKMGRLNTFNLCFYKLFWGIPFPSNTVCRWRCYSYI